MAALVLAAASTDATFTESEWFGGSESESMAVVFPEADYQHRKGFAIRADSIADGGDVTDIRVAGSQFNDRAAYLPALGGSPVTQVIGGHPYRVFVGSSDDYASEGLSQQERTFALTWPVARGADLSSALVLAATSADSMVSEADWLLGNSSATPTVEMPAAGALHYKAFAVRRSEIDGRVDDLRVRAHPFNERESYRPRLAEAPEFRTIGGIEWSTLVGLSPDYGNAASSTRERTYELTFRQVSRLDAAALAGILGTNDTHAGRVLPVAEAVVLKFAPRAPAVVKREAMIRTAGYLVERPAWGPAGEGETIGPMVASRDYAAGAISALRASGAMALLSPWKSRRAL